MPIKWPKNKFLNIDLEKIYKYEDITHKTILKDSFKIMLTLLENEKFKNLSDKIIFTWWTSLMFKYWNKFKRFSKDIDFSIDFKFENETINSNEFFVEFKKQIELDMNRKWIQILDDPKSNWQTIFFLWEQWDKREFKIDFMYDSIIKEEEIEIWENIITKVSDLDIICNKLQRLSNIDIFDIDFLFWKLYSRDKQKLISDVFDWLKIKSENKGWIITLFNKNKYNWEKNIDKLPFLKDLINKFNNNG